MRRWTVAVIVAAFCGLSLILFAFLTKPVADFGESGTFANDCCGTIELSHGKMLLNDQGSVRYTVGHDAHGPYILPGTSVGVVQDEGFDIDGTRSTAKLRLDRLPRPTKITLHEGLRPYVFTRAVAAAHDQVDH